MLKAVEKVAEEYLVLVARRKKLADLVSVEAALILLSNVQTSSKKSFKCAVLQK